MILANFYCDTPVPPKCPIKSIIFQTTTVWLLELSNWRSCDWLTSRLHPAAAAAPAFFGAVKTPLDKSPVPWWWWWRAGLIQNKIQTKTVFLWPNSPGPAVLGACHSFLCCNWNSRFTTTDGYSTGEGQQQYKIQCQGPGQYLVDAEIFLFLAQQWKYKFTWHYMLANSNLPKVHIN